MKTALPKNKIQNTQGCFPSGPPANQRKRQGRERPASRRAARRRGCSGIPDAKGGPGVDAFLEIIKYPALACLKDATVLGVNEAFEMMSGFTRQEIKARKTWTAFFENGFSTPLSFREDFTPEKQECQLIDRNGAMRKVILSATAAPGGEALLLTFEETGPDRGKARLTERERPAFLSVLQKAPYGALVLDGQGRNLFVNHEFTSLTGYGREDIPLTRDWLRAAFPDREYRRSVIGSWTRDLKTGEASDRIFRVFCKTGEVKEIEFRTAELEGEGFIVMLSDVTSRRAAERALKESEQKFRALFERSADAIILYDGKVIVDANPAALRMIRCGDKDQLVGLRPSDLSPERQPDGSLSTEKARDVTALGSDTGPLRFEWLHKRFDGSEFPVEVVYTPIPMDGAQIFHCVWRDISESKRAEEQLRLAQFAVDIAKDSIFWMDRDGRFTYANDAACAISGYSREELLSMSVRDVDPNLPGEDLKAYWDLKRQKGAVAFESTHRMKDGALYPVEISSSYLNFGGKEYACSIVRDITGRRAQEAALRESESKFRALAEKTSAGVYLYQDDIFQYVNPAFADIHGYGAEELPGRLRLTEIIHPQDLIRVRDGIKKRLSGEIESLHTEFRTLKKDGRVITVEAHGSRITYRGRPAVIGTLIEITERKKAESTLRESEEKFHQLFEQNEEALIILRSGSARILDANPAAVDLYGFGKKALVEHGPSLFLTPADLAKFEETLHGTRGPGSFVIENIQTRGKDGRKIIVTIRGKSIRLSDVDVVYCTFRDITEKTRLEQEASLLHSKLIQANKMTSLGVLVSSVAHEVNNPNNFIMFNASLLGDAWQDALKIMKEYSLENGEFTLGGLPFSEMEGAVAKLLHGITEGSRRINEIVDNLKNFARQDNAGLEEMVDVNRAVSDSQSILAGQIKRYTRSFSMDLAPNLPHVKGSFQQLEQVIINLIMNALQALPDKDHTIGVSTRRDPDHAHVRIEVKDNGAGMSREIMKKITEPFFTTKLDTGGTGLGLSISHSIIKDHHGLMEFQSKPGKGTTAVIKIPIFHNPERNDS
jgi:PAS domain S-box-containing protein